MTRTPRYLTRRQNLAFGFVLSLVMGTAMWLGDDLMLGLEGFAIVFGWTVITCVVPKDRFELIRVGEPRDERQDRLSSEASELAGYAVITFALAGAIWDTAHGRVGEFALVCAVGGASFILAQLILPRVR